MTIDYNKLHKIYHHTKSNPVKKYSEQHTFFQILGNIHGKSVLDVACGDGYYTRLIKKSGADKIIGVDISDKMIEKAVSIEKKNPLNIEYYVKDAKNLGNIGLFDYSTAVYLFTYANNINSLKLMCNQIYKNLKKNGVLVALTLNPELSQKHMDYSKKYGAKMEIKEPIHNGSEINIEIETPYGPINFNNYFWDKQTYEMSLKNAGFKTIKWYDPLVSEKGIKKYGRQYFSDHLIAPGFAIIKCF